MKIFGSEFRASNNNSKSQTVHSYAKRGVNHSAVAGLLLFTLYITACGGGGSGGSDSDSDKPTTATGQFKDSNVTVTWSSFLIHPS